LPLAQSVCTHLLQKLCSSNPANQYEIKSNPL
jgi:hypothetical protein